MKILQMHIGMSLMGGIESVIIGLANEMSKEHDVRFCSIFKPVDGGIYYTRFSERVKKEQLGIEKNGFSIRNLWKVFYYLYHTDAEIIHLHGFFYYYALPIILFHNRFVFVYTFHSDACWENSKWDHRILWVKKFCLRHHWINAVTISPESKDSFVSLYGLDSRLVRNGVSRPMLYGISELIEKYRMTSETKVFLHPGRISFQKNQVVLCKVFSRLIAEGEDVVLLLAGTKQEELIYHQLVPMFCERVIYLGERNDVAQLLSCADGFCLPSLYEGLPIALLESLSVGCVPICSPVGGIVGVIQNGINGFLSDSPSEDDYYCCMKSFLKLNKAEISIIRNNCIESYEPYEISNMVNQYLKYYEELLDGKSSVIHI